MDGKNDDGQSESEDVPRNIHRNILKSSRKERELWMMGSRSFLGLSRINSNSPTQRNCCSEGRRVRTALQRKKPIYCFHKYSKRRGYTSQRAKPVESREQEGISQEDEYEPPLSQDEAPRPPQIDWEDIVLVQAFGWDSCRNDGHWYSIVEKHIPILKSLQATHVWLPPPSASVSKEGYLPTQYYNLSSPYGNIKSLKSLNAQLLKQGIRPVADIVINHRCADAQDENGIYNMFRDDVPHPGSRIDWGPWAITCNDPDFNGKGSRDTGEDYGPSPDLDHNHPLVQQGIIDWLRWLRTHIGFEGWRLDFAKGYDGTIATLYLSSTLNQECLDLGKKIRGDFAVAEYWADAQWNGSQLSRDQNAMRQSVCDWLDDAKRSSAFDFVTKAILQEAVRHCQYDRLRDSEGKPPGLLGWWPEKSVTFIDNHDTGSSQQHWPFPEEGILQGYAYILTHPGIPCLFWEHIMDPSMAKVLCQLVMLRKAAGVRADSDIEILEAQESLYIARIDRKILVKLGPKMDMGSHTPPKGSTLKCYGTDWAVWLLPSLHQ